MRRWKFWLIIALAALLVLGGGLWIYLKWFAGGDPPEERTVLLMADGPEQVCATPDGALLEKDGTLTRIGMTGKAHWTVEVPMRGGHLAANDHLVAIWDSRHVYLLDLDTGLSLLKQDYETDVLAVFPGKTGYSAVVDVNGERRVQVYSNSGSLIDELLFPDQVVQAADYYGEKTTALWT